MFKQNKTEFKITIVSKEEFQSMVRQRLPSFWLWVMTIFIFMGVVNVAMLYGLFRLETIIIAIAPSISGAAYAIYMHRDSKRLK